MTTAEAADSYRTFHESLRFPLPDGPVEVTVLRRREDQSFARVWQTRIDPADPFVMRAPPARQELLEIERHGEPADKVDLLLIGDGYTAAECAGKFGPDARRMANALFRHEPFAARRSDFNVWGLCPPSQDSGIARPSNGTQRRTPSAPPTTCSARSGTCSRSTTASCAMSPAWAPYEFIAILVNAATYGGGGIHGSFATVAVDSDWADYLFVHEFGHHFAGLADEYYTSPVAYAPAATVVEPWEANVTALLGGLPPKWATSSPPARPCRRRGPSRSSRRARAHSRRCASRSAPSAVPSAR